MRINGTRAFQSLLLAGLLIGIPLGQRSEGQQSTGVIRVTVSVDWEGRELAERNLLAMEKFRTALPKVPLTHFLNAAYYTKSGAKAEDVSKRMKRVHKKGDEFGLHIHAWKSLIEASGVTFRNSPTFWGGSARASRSDYGHDVEIAAYTVAELRSVVKKSQSLLKAGGFQLSPSFRAGGWVAPNSVLEAIRAEGLTIDSSATDLDWHDELDRYPLRKRLRKLWAGVNSKTQPYLIKTPVGNVLEMPDTGALADYVTANEMEGHLLEGLVRLNKDPSKDIYIHIGFHQETAERYCGRVQEAITRVKKAHGPKFIFETLENAAKRAIKTATVKQKIKKRSF
jgi:hypothetical protein